MNTPPIVSSQEWVAARDELLVKEKQLTRARDALAAQRRRMPWTAVEKDYAFEGPNGPATLSDLFDGRRQLVVYRFFFEPGVSGWPESGCPGCSFLADQVAHPAHLNARDTTLVFVSRAPQADIERLKARMGWELTPWYTLTDDFDADFGVGEWQHLELPRHHGARPSGDVGGLAGGLSADRPVHVVEPPRRVRQVGRRLPVVIAHVGGLPVEELLPALAGSGTGLVALRAWDGGEECGGGAHYRGVAPPNRLAFTWIWDGETRRTLIELDFEESGGVTKVHFTHSGLLDEATVRSHDGGWSRALDNLAEELEARR